MELNLEKFKIRKTKPIILGNAGLPDDTERYHLEGMEMIGKYHLPNQDLYHLR